MSKDGHFRIEWKILAGRFTDSAEEDKMLFVLYLWYAMEKWEKRWCKDEKRVTKSPSRK